MKRRYVKHQCSGPKNIKRSRGALRRHHGVETRGEAWKPTPELQDASQVSQHIETDTGYPLSSTSTEDSTIDTVFSKPPKADYTRRPKMRLEASSTAQQTHDVTVMFDTCASTCQVVQQSYEEHALEIEYVAPETMKGIDGYRIIDAKHVLSWCLTLQQNHSKICTLGRIEFSSEIRKGLFSTFIFLCNACNRKFVRTSEPLENPKANKACVWGTLTSGSYYAQMNHLLCVMDIPTMSSKTYRKIENNLGNIWEKHLWEEIIETGKKEMAVAIEKGHISEDGVPYITAYVDGGWSKRSYGHDFNASSGAACIIGAETKKCIYLGVRNKFCIACKINEKNNMMKEHICFKNYTGSSTAMEADIIVEGFSKSLKLHGFKILTFIGDGDSSVFARLREHVPYGNNITKLECKNHVIKNYTSSLYKILGNTKLPLEGRKLLKTRLQKLSTVARKNIIHNSKNGTVANLRNDFQDGVYHVFGNHTKCKPYYCKWKEAEIKKNVIEKDNNDLEKIKQQVSVWSLLTVAIDTLIRKADRLLHNETTNCAESFMALVAKYNCGKRINLTNKGSFQHRVHIAALDQIQGHDWHHRAWMKTANQSPGKNWENYALRRKKSREMKKRLGKHRKIYPCSKPKLDKNYGPKADDPPPTINEDDLKILCAEKLKEFEKTPDEIEMIQKGSIGQHGNHIYDFHRKHRLTASLFGMVSKRRSTTSSENHIKRILYPKPFQTTDTNYRTVNESLAIRMFENLKNKKVQPAGLFVDQNYGFLAASPDGIITDENAIVEVKCFPSIKRMQTKTFEFAAEKKYSFPLKLNNGLWELKKQHDYYYQIQGQLRITKSNKCYFICFIDVSSPLLVIEIHPDDEFINKMFEKLEVFFKKFVLPEIVTNRLGK